MKKHRIAAIMLTGVMLFGITGCENTNTDMLETIIDKRAEDTEDESTDAKSLKEIMGVETNATEEESSDAQSLETIVEEHIADAKEKAEKMELYNEYVQLGEYIGIEYTRDVAEVTEEDVKAQLDSFLLSLSEVKEVTGRGVKSGDIVNINYTIYKDGRELDGYSETNYDLIIGSGIFIDEFEEGLIGHKTGETVSLNMTYPDDDIDPKLAGKEIVAEVTINSISFTENIPKLTDKLVKTNTDYATIDEYKKSIKESLVLQNEEAADAQADSDIFAKVVENATITGYDSTEVEELVNMTKASYDEIIQSYINYGYTNEDVLSMYGYKSEEALLEGLTEYAESYLQQKMIVYVIAEKEGIKVSNSEMDEMFKEYIARYGVETEEELYEVTGMDKDAIELTVLSEKVTAFLRKNAVLVEHVNES